MQNQIVTPRQRAHPIPRVRKTTTHRASLFSWVCSFCPPLFRAPWYRKSLCNVGRIETFIINWNCELGSNLCFDPHRSGLSGLHQDFQYIGKINSIYLTMFYIFSIWYRNKKWKLKSHSRTVFQFVSLQAATAPSTTVLPVPGGASAASDSYCSSVGSQSGQNPARYAV